MNNSELLLLNTRHTWLSTEDDIVVDGCNFIAGGLTAKAMLQFLDQ